MEQLANVHGHNDLGFASVGKQIARILGGNAALDEIGIGREGGTHGSIIFLGGTCFDDGVGNDELRLFPEGHVTLRLLVVGSKTMPDELVRHRA